MEQIINISKNMSSSCKFENLLRPYLHHLYRVAFRFTRGSVADGEDLVQELLIKLYAQRQQLEQIEQLRPWLVKILYRLFIDHIRKQNRSPLHLVANSSQEQVDIVDTLACKRQGPEDIVAARYDKSQLMAAVNGLNEDQRAVCILHDMEGYTLVELEEILATPLGTLKSRLHRARAHLRKVLQIRGIGDREVNSKKEAEYEMS